MKEMENHLLGHLSIFDSWLKLRRHVAVSFACSGHKTEVNVGIFTHLRLSWLESPENNIKGIKSLRQIENKAWSVTVGKFLQPVSPLNRPGFFCFCFFFVSINSSLSPLIYSWKMRHCFKCYHRNTEKHTTTPTAVTKNKKYRSSAIQRVQQLWKFECIFIVNLRLAPLSECALIFPSDW